MNWEDSKACTPLKQDILTTWFRHEDRFFLTGGSALGLFYLHHRRSYDLDLFTCDKIPHLEIQSLIKKVGNQIGAIPEALRTSPDFLRFRFTRGEDEEIMDIVIDHAPQLDRKKNNISGIRVDTLREILANKLTTLLSRSEPKDLIDLYFLEQAGHDILAAIPDARTKDGGWDPAIVAMLLEGLKLDDLTLLLVKDLDQEKLKAFQQRLRLTMAKLALPESEG